MVHSEWCILRNRKEFSIASLADVYLLRQVNAVELGSVLNKGAYMIFYSRCSPRAPRSIRSTIISRDLSNKISNPKIYPSSKQRDHNTDDLANHGYIHQDETRLPEIPNIIEFDSSSDNSSLFSHSDEVSSSTDSTRESIGVDDISDYIFGNSFWRQSSDSDTSSSSSSSSSSPHYTKHSPLSNSERCASSLSEPSVMQTDNTHLVHMGYPSRAKTSGFSFLDSNSSKQVRKVVNISSCRKADFETLGCTNPLDNARSGVHLRRSLSKKAD